MVQGEIHVRFTGPLDLKRLLPSHHRLRRRELSRGAALAVNPDVVSSIFDRVRILYQVHPGVFRPGPALGEGFLFAQRALLEDFDGDGDLDAATTEVFNSFLLTFFGSH